MNVYILLALCIGLPTAMGVTDEMKALAANLHKTCVAESGVDEALIEKVNSEKMFGDDDKLKCYVKCIMTQTGCMDDNGTIDVDAVIAFIPEEIKEKAAPMIKECGSKVGGNHCENAWLTHKCYLENGPEQYVLI